MKILILGNIPPPTGGAEVQTQLLGVGLTKVGYDVHILRWHDQYYSCVDGAKLVVWNERNSAIADGLSVHPLLTSSPDYVSPPKEGWKKNRAMANVLSLRRRIPVKNLGLRNLVNALYPCAAPFFSEFNRFLWKLRPDIFHVQDLQNCGPFLPWYRRLHKPLVITVHYGGVYDIEEWARYKKNIFEGLEKAEALIAVCNAIRLKLMELGVDPSKIRVIPNGVDTHVFTPRNAHKEDRLVCVNRLVPRKGTELLIRAMPKILAKSKVHLDIIGEGPSIHTLMHLASKLKVGKYVHFLGEIPNDRLPEYLNKASIFLLPSYIEGLPVSLLEAMACQLSVISTSVGGIPEVIKNGKNGLLIEPGDISGLSDSVLSLLNDRQNAGKLARRARKTVCSAHTIKRVVEKTDQVYREVTQA